LTWRDTADTAADRAHKVLRSLSEQGAPDSVRVAASRALIDLAIANPAPPSPNEVLDEESADLALAMIISSIESSTSGTAEQRGVAIEHLEGAAAAVAALHRSPKS